MFYFTCNHGLMLLNLVSYNLYRPIALMSYFVLTFWANDLCAKSNENCDRKTGGRVMTERQKDVSDSVICPMLCYAIAMGLIIIT